MASRVFGNRFLLAPKRNDAHASRAWKALFGHDGLVNEIIEGHHPVDVVNADEFDAFRALERFSAVAAIS